MQEIKQRKRQAEVCREFPEFGVHDRMLRQDDREVEIGKTNSCFEQPGLCDTGENETAVSGRGAQEARSVGRDMKRTRQWEEKPGNEAVCLEAIKAIRQVR